MRLDRVWADPIGTATRTAAPASTPAAGIVLMLSPGCRTVAMTSPTAAAAQQIRMERPRNERPTTATAMPARAATAAGPTTARQYSSPLIGAYSSWTSSAEPCQVRPKTHAVDTPASSTSTVRAASSRRMAPAASAPSRTANSHIPPMATATPRYPMPSLHTQVSAPSEPGAPVLQPMCSCLRTSPIAAGPKISAANPLPTTTQTARRRDLCESSCGFASVDV